METGARRACLQLCLRRFTADLLGADWLRLHRVLMQSRLWRPATWLASWRARRVLRALVATCNDRLRRLTKSAHCAVVRSRSCCAERLTSQASFRYAMQRDASDAIRCARYARGRLLFLALGADFYTDASTLGSCVAFAGDADWSTTRTCPSSCVSVGCKHNVAAALRDAFRVSFSFARTHEREWECERQSRRTRTRLCYQRYSTTHFSVTPIRNTQFNVLDSVGCHGFRGSWSCLFRNQPQLFHRVIVCSAHPASHCFYIVPIPTLFLVAVQNVLRKYTQETAQFLLFRVALPVEGHSAFTQRSRISETRETLKRVSTQICNLSWNQTVRVTNHQWSHFWVSLRSVQQCCFLNQYQQSAWPD